MGPPIPHAADTPRAAAPSLHSAPLRVLLIIDSMGLGGAQTGVIGFCARSERSRFRVLVCSLGRSRKTTPRLEAVGAEVRVLSISRWSPFYGRPLRRIADEFKPDILYCHLPKSLIAGSSLARARSLPLVYHSHGNAAMKSPHGILARLFGAGLWFAHARRCRRRASAVIACAHTLADDIRRLNMVAPHKLHVVPNGIQLEWFEFSDGERQEARRAVRSEFSLPDKAILILNAARFSDQKNWPVFLRAVAAARRAVPDVCALAVGDGPLLGKMHHMSGELGLGEAVRLPGFRDDVPRLMLASDVLLLPSTWEGDSLVVKEAMACGLPVVGFAAGDTGIAVREGRDGYILPIGDNTGLKTRLCEVVQDDKLRAALSASAHARAMADFGVEKTVKKIEKVLRQTASG